ncbi:type II toxin-antitoxin system HicA family toxin [Collinsella tanakaei]|uniref:type II toxin-antitoxin system HicA family toxin n=1 Tax=Collinsella tanakaei TaxID=626935 RepID=UPI00195C44B1|nr:type II toxin-antitoxin system HicA family toxin [Collinsella tanakaei]MBM6756718.1 type II toxin-antitoxin system HicA family toxin [Collinsella tanakaei]
MKRRDLVKELTDAGFWQPQGERKGTKHDKFTDGEVTVMVPRHSEIKETTAKSILKRAGLR